EGDKRRRMSTMGVCSSGKHQELPDPLPHTWPRGGRTSLAALHPALAGDPADRLARAAIAERLDTFLGQAARPFPKPRGPSGFQPFLRTAQRDRLASQVFHSSPQPKAKKWFTTTREITSALGYCVTTPPVPPPFPALPWSGLSGCHEIGR